MADPRIFGPGLSGDYYISSAYRNGPGPDTVTITGRKYRVTEQAHALQEAACERGRVEGRADERARLRALLEREAVIKAASLEIGKLRCAEAGGCYAPDGEADEDCSYGDCWCARQAEKEASAALAAVAERVEGA